MKTLHFSTFPHRSWAESARRGITRDIGANDDRPIRLHEGEIDLLTAADLSGCAAQSRRERSIAHPFLTWFFAFAAVGLVIDLFVITTFTGLVATMLLGSLGVVAGTIAVLASEVGPMDRAFSELGDSLREGDVVLTVRCSTADRDEVARRVTEHGGRGVFEA